MNSYTLGVQSTINRMVLDGDPSSGICLTSVGQNTVQFWTPVASSRTIDPRHPPGPSPNSPVLLAPGRCFTRKTYENRGPTGWFLGETPCFTPGTGRNLRPQPPSFSDEMTRASLRSTPSFRQSCRRQQHAVQPEEVIFLPNASTGVVVHWHRVRLATGRRLRRKKGDKRRTRDTSCS